MRSRALATAPHQFGAARQLLAVGAITLLTFGLSATPGVAQVPSPRPSSSRPPNIVMIFTDDQGWNDVGCYGSEIPTPNIDRLARQGVRLTQFYAASSICTPSRYGLLTGRNPTHSRDGLLGALMFLTDSDSQRGIQAGETTYVSRLREAGYQTALVGKWHLGHGSQAHWPTQHGFETFFGHTGGCVDYFTLHYGIHPDWYRGQELVQPAGYATDVITDEAIRFIEQDRRPDTAFYLHVAYNAPHFGKAGDFLTGEIQNKMQPKPSDSAGVPEEIQGDARRSFAAKVMGLDDSVGRLLDVLQQQDLEQNTLVIFMTDHGGDPVYGGSNLPLRGGKATLFEGGIRVPCIARLPGRIAAGTQSDILASGLDCFPTLCELAGVEFDAEGVEGISLLPALDSQASEATRRATYHAASQRDLLWHTGSHSELQRSRWTALRQGDWKIVQQPGEATWLFNIQKDPNESHNLAETLPDVLAKMTARAKNLLAESP